MTPLATRLRELLADPRPKRKADREAWEGRGLLILRRECAAVLRLLDAAKRGQGWIHSDVCGRTCHRDCIETREAVAALEAAPGAAGG
jgi:hypothetical protein